MENRLSYLALIINQDRELRTQNIKDLGSHIFVIWDNNINIRTHWFHRQAALSKLNQVLNIFQET